MVTAITETICSLVPKFCTVAYSKHSPSSSGSSSVLHLDQNGQIYPIIETIGHKHIKMVYFTSLMD